MEEEGPFHVFEHMRTLLDVDRPGEQGFWQTLFSCIFCMSVWTAAIAWLVLRVFRLPFLLYILSASTVGIFLQFALGKLEKE